MAHPHQSYPHAGQPYYQHPHPGYPYQHGGAYYPPYPMSPMNGPSMPPHQPASPRMNGSGRGGYHPHRAGGQSYPQYPQYPPPYMHQPMPAPISPMTPPSPYAHPQKYPPHPQPHIPYSHPYQHPPNGYNGSWSTPAQTLSPLPKQLSMPVQLPQSQPQQPVEPPVPAPVAVPESTPETHHSEQPSAPSDVVESEAVPVEPAPEVHPTPPPIEEKPATPPPEPAPVIARSPSPPPDSPASTSSRLSQGPTAPTSFVIWSRKPRDPSRAQAVMISARAHPPQDMLEQAMDIRTPPQTPKLAPVKLALQEEDIQPKEAAESSLEAFEPASSSATETTSSLTAPETPVAGSPSTAHTSVAGPSPVVQNKALDSAEAKTGSAEPVASTSSSAPVPTQTSAEPSSVQAPAPPTQVPAAKPASSGPKKSWASLLQPTDAAASSSKSRLPTSAVVGFSIPAGLQNGTSSQASTSSSSTAPARPEVLNLLNNGPSGPAHAPKIRPRGLVNTGNMCFANAVLQTLVYCQPFNRLFSELGKYISGPVVGSQKEGSQATPLVDATIQFLKEFAPKEVDESKNSKSKGKEREEDFDDLDSFIPTYVYEAMKEKKRFASMIGGHQEDAEEFLGFFLDTLEEELLSITSSLTSKTAKKEEAVPSGDSEWLEVGKKNRAATTRSTKIADSPITRIFGGKFRSTLKAPHQRDSITEEDWRSLRLDIQRETVHSIKDALQFISHPHSVEITAPTRPGVVIEATRQELIESLPPVLVLHLKRFLYDTNVGDVVKLGKQVTFDPELEIGPDLIAPIRRTAHPVKYQLFGALYHHGQSASGGHYTLDVLHPNRDMNDKPRQAWIRIDDELVSDIRHEDIFGAQERDDRCAYLLFYRRIGAGLSNKPWSQAAR